MEFRPDFNPLKLRTTDQTQKMVKKEPSDQIDKTSCQKARINNLFHDNSLSGHSAAIIDCETIIKADLEAIALTDKFMGMSIVRPVDQFFEKLISTEIKQNFTINLSESGDLVIGKDSGSSAGHLNNLGIFLNESHENHINFASGSIRFSEDLSDKDIKLINKFLENKEIYLLTESQFNKLQQIINNNRILNETAPDSQKDAQKPILDGKTPIQTTKEPTTEVAASSLETVVDKPIKKAKTPSTFTQDQIAADKAKEKKKKYEDKQNEIIEAHEKTLEHQKHIDSRVQSNKDHANKIAEYIKNRKTPV